jgi:hypothetical protein
MSSARAATESIVDAGPDTVYTVIADYTRHHPQIMPPTMFSDLTVESGGVGAGTVFHISLRVAGRTQRLRMRVAEPEPGRVLTETNECSGAVTAFTVTAVNVPGSSRVRIATEWEPSPGLRGLVDRVATPVLMRRIFRQQLARLSRYVRSGVVIPNGEDMDETP